MRLFRRSTQQRPSRQVDGRPVLREAPAKSYSQRGRLVSGNGTLVLTEQELLFEQDLPRRVVRAPRASIVEVSTARAFRSRIFPRLLKVAWSAEAGARDSIVLMVKDVDGWIEALGQRDGASPS